MSAPLAVAVIGAGTMGHGIAYVSAVAGCRVWLTDADPARLGQAVAKIDAAFEHAIARGKCTPVLRDVARLRIETVPTPEEAVREASLVIEAIPERLDAKQRLFAAIERFVGPEAVLASNTSSLSITEIGRQLQHRERMIGLHFFNPVAAMKLLEIVRGRDTSEATVEHARAFAALLGKTPIVVRDAPGFATSRLGVVLGLEAIRMLEEEVASAEDIDRAMELGYNHPVGPLRLTDLVGLDVRLAIAEHLHATLGGEAYRPPALLRDKVRRGELGRKSGQGFYRWEEER